MLPPVLMLGAEPVQSLYASCTTPGEPPMQGDPQTAVSVHFKAPSCFQSDVTGAIGYRGDARAQEELHATTQPARTLGWL